MVIHNWSFVVKLCGTIAISYMSFVVQLLSHKPKSGFVVKPAAGDETGCNVAIPNPRRNFLAGGPRAHQYTLAHLTSRRLELGYATLQPTPVPYHKHFSERFSKIHVYHKQKRP